MQCCANCFGDQVLETIISSLSSDSGTCSYCRSSLIAVVSPSTLAELFAPLISVYEPDSENGQLLVEHMTTDWGMFRHPAMDMQRARSLLTDILNDGEIARQRFSFSPRYRHDGLHLKWDALRDELMFKNRYFPEANVDLQRLESLIRLLEASEYLPIWKRARLQSGPDAFSIDQMGAPPQSVSTHGRANPAGIPYLYLGSTDETAVAEVRPHTGELATVADFDLPAGLRFIDLRNPRKLISPFLFGDEDEIASLWNDIPFLERLGVELTRPVLPQRAAVDYVPSQYLCEFIKKIGYDGVIYSSSVSEGMNLALFNPEVAVGRATRCRSVSRVSVEII